MTIKELIKKNGGIAFGNGGSIKKIEGMLMNDEAVIYALSCNAHVFPISGQLKVDPMALKDKTPGVVVISTSRIIFCNNILGSGTAKQLSLTDITSVDEATTFSQSALRVRGATEMFVFDLNKKQNKEMQTALSTAKAGLQGSQQIHVVENKTSSDADELVKFKKLLDDGVITADEFEAKKKIILGL